MNLRGNRTDRDQMVRNLLSLFFEEGLPTEIPEGLELVWNPALGLTRGLVVYGAGQE